MNVNLNVISGPGEKENDSKELTWYWFGVDMVVTSRTLKKTTIHLKRNFSSVIMILFMENEPSKHEYPTTFEIPKVNATPYRLFKILPLPKYYISLLILTFLHGLGDFPRPAYERVLCCPDLRVARVPVANDVLEEVAGQAGGAGVDEDEPLLQGLEDVWGHLYRGDGYVEGQFGLWVRHLEPPEKPPDLVLPPAARGQQLLQVKHLLSNKGIGMYFNGSSLVTFFRKRKKGKKKKKKNLNRVKKDKIPQNVKKSDAVKSHLNYEFKKLELSMSLNACYGLYQLSLQSMCLNKSSLLLYYSYLDFF